MEKITRHYSRKQKIETITRILQNDCVISDEIVKKSGASKKTCAKWMNNYKNLVLEEYGNMVIANKEKAVKEMSGFKHAENKAQVGFVKKGAAELLSDDLAMRQKIFDVQSLAVDKMEVLIKKEIDLNKITNAFKALHEALNNTHKENDATPNQFVMQFINQVQIRNNKPDEETNTNKFHYDQIN